MTLRLPDTNGALRAYEPRAVPLALTTGAPFTSRTVFSAAHVVADPFADVSPDSAAAVDWDATLAFRRHLWSHGLGVAEAMDTAQRGMGLDWAGAAELIRRSAAEAKAVGGRIACGVGTDQLTGPASLEEVRTAYEEQLALVEESGAQAILMASRALAATAKGPRTTWRSTGICSARRSSPWSCTGSAPCSTPPLRATGVGRPGRGHGRVPGGHRRPPGQGRRHQGLLLDARREVDLRRRLPQGVRCYTGDDFNYPELIAGDEQGFSHALLGIFDPLGPLAAEAVRVLDTGDVKGFRELLDPTVELSRHLFEAPTRFYKTGVVLLAWLAGHQEHFTMVGGLQSARSLPHFARAYELADTLGLFPDPELAEARMKTLLALYGVTS